MLNTAIQLSIYDLPTTSTPTDNHPSNNIIKFPIQYRQPHTQQRVSPIRDPELVNKIYTALKSTGRYGLRNATIFALQLAIGRRTNDILSMKLKDIYDFSTHTVKSIITVDEHKTGKTARDLPVPQTTAQCINNYIRTLKSRTPDSLLFPSQRHNPDGSQRPLSTASLDNIYQDITTAIYAALDTPETHISSYAARKTYGYNIYMECMKNNGQLPGTDINALQYVQSCFNHRDTMTTLRYIGAYDAPAQKLAENIQNQYSF